MHTALKGKIKREKLFSQIRKQDYKSEFEIP